MWRLLQQSGHEAGLPPPRHQLPIPPLQRLGVQGRVSRRGRSCERAGAGGLGGTAGGVPGGELAYPRCPSCCTAPRCLLPWLPRSCLAMLASKTPPPIMRRARTSAHRFPPLPSPPRPQQEAQRLHSLRHSNVVALYGISFVGSRGMLLMEFCEGRDLHAALNVVERASGKRLFGWHRKGKRVAYEMAKVSRSGGAAFQESCYETSSYSRFTSLLHLCSPLRPREGGCHVTDPLYAPPRLANAHPRLPCTFQALNYFHSKSVVHYDVKAANCLLTSAGVSHQRPGATEDLWGGVAVLRQGSPCPCVVPYAPLATPVA